MANDHKDFLFRRLHTLAGVVPVGLFVIIHLVTNSTATKGPAAFNQSASTLEHMPYLQVVEFLFIFLPLVYHGIYGMYVAFTSGYNAGRYGWFRNWMFVLQRVTGVITFVFIIYHLWTTRFSGQPPTFDMMAAIVASRVQFWFMIVGIVAAVFHFSNGLWSFCVHWGITVGPRAQKVAAYAFGLFFIVLSYIGVDALVAFTRHGA